MTDLMRYASQLTDNPTGKGLPPVHLWDPPYCGELDLVILSDGTWLHEGTPIGRAKLVRLFSTVLKKENGQHFLVTPVEKLSIRVEDAPFLAVLCDRIENDNKPVLQFTTNVGDVVEANKDHPIIFRPRPSGKDSAPYIHVRGGLEAKLARPVYYDLVSIAETQTVAGQDQFGVWSANQFFPFSLATDVFKEMQE